MQKLKHKLALTAFALAFTPITVIQLIATGNPFAISFGALAAMFAGMVFTLAAVEVMRNKKW